MADAPALSIVIPMLNEEKVVTTLLGRLVAALDPMGVPFEIVCVDDGSKDGTVATLTAANASDSRVRAVILSRNFGKERAMMAGLDASRGLAVVVMDADLQHPPETVPTMFECLNQGFEVVHAVRRARTGQGLLRRLLSRIFYATMVRAAEIEIVEGAGDFSIMTREVALALRELRESNRYWKGLFAWAGFRTSFVEFDQGDREAGVSRWTFVTLLRLAIEGITSFSMVPLRLATYLGLAVASLALASAVYYFARAALYGDPVQGYPSLFVAMLFLGSVQLMCLGVIGEYVGRTYLEAKRRPLYFVRETIGGPRRPGPADARD